MSLFKERDDVCQQSLWLCGFTFQTAWMCLILFKPFRAGFDYMGAVRAMPSESVVELACVAACLIGVLLGRRLARASKSPLYIIGCTALLLAASLSTLLFHWAEPALIAIDTAIRVLCLLLMVSWLRIFNGFDSDTIFKALPAILASAVAGSTVIVAFYPFVGAIHSLNIALALLSAGFLLAARHFGSDDRQSTQAPAPNAWAKFAIAVGLAAVPMGILSGLSNLANASLPQPSLMLIFLLLLFVAMLAIGIHAFAQEKEAQGDLFSFAIPRIALPVALLVAAVAVGAALQADFWMVVNTFGRQCLEIALLLCFLEGARFVRVETLRAYLSGQAIFVAVNTATGIASNALFSRHDASELISGGILLLLLACEGVAIVAFLIMSAKKNQRELREEALMEELGEPSANSGGDPDTAAENAAPTAKDDQPETDTTSMPGTTGSAPAEGALASRVEIMAQLFGLSEMEQKVLRLTMRGRSRQRISQELYIAPGTVSTYQHRIYQKVGVSNRQELIDAFESAAARKAD